jgi:hypothetical protein
MPAAEPEGTPPHHDPAPRSSEGPAEAAYGEALTGDSPCSPPADGANTPKVGDPDGARVGASPVTMRELLASCAAAHAVSTPPWHSRSSTPQDAGAGQEPPAGGRPR